MRLRSGVLVASVVLLLAGCSSAPGQRSAEDPLTGVDLSAVSEAQAAEISDRVATADEYQAAFQRYRECLSAAGFELRDMEYTGLVYQYGVPDEAVQDGADDECYESEFRYTDILWQGTDAVQNSSETAQFVRECLQDQGIEPADTMKEMDAQLREAGIEITTCPS
jgi:hypothetical protein